MEFWKMNGAGNDFIVIDNRNEQIPWEKLPAAARILCKRHLSIGADGLMAVEESDRADYKMLFYNADGSLGEMCGNGVRCICRYGYETGLAGEAQTVETTAGIVTGWRIDRRQYKVRLNDPSIIENRPIEVDGTPYPCTYVELGDPGVPHAVVPMENLQTYPADALFALGRKMRYHPAFPKGANVNFYQLIGKDHLYEHTYERGVEDFTYACGSGTGSLVAALTLQGIVSGQGVQVDMTGGRLMIHINRTGNHIDDVYLTGPTNIVAKGEITDEDWLPAAPQPFI